MLTYFAILSLPLSSCTHSLSLSLSLTHTRVHTHAHTNRHKKETHTNTDTHTDTHTLSQTYKVTKIYDPLVRKVSEQRFLCQWSNQLNSPSKQCFGIFLLQFFAVSSRYVVGYILGMPTNVSKLTIGESSRWGKDVKEMRHSLYKIEYWIPEFKMFGQWHVAKYADYLWDIIRVKLTFRTGVPILIPHAQFYCTM